MSFPVLGLFRSQHDNQSWVSAMSAILDACALVTAGMPRADVTQARLTFAMAWHAVVDMTHVYRLEPALGGPDRLPPDLLRRLRAALAAANMPLTEGDEVDRKLAELRAMYEPQIAALGDFLLMSVPSWLPSKRPHDNWQALV